MAFGVSSVARSDNSSKKEVDYEALNKYVVETAQLKRPETLTGYVVGIVDLGEQDQPDAEYPFDGDAADEADAIDEKPGTYFKDGIDEKTKKPVRLKCWKQKPIQSVTLAIDFPDIMVDKGQFFGESNPQPLRMWLGGSFFLKDVGHVVGRPTPLKITKATGKWSFDKKHLFHKMAVCSKLIESDGVFLPQDIDQLLGKAFQFQAQIFFNEKGYYTENIKFIGGLGRGQAEPELVTETFCLQFNETNSELALHSLRHHILNTIKRAKNYDESLLKGQLESGKSSSSEPQKEEQSTKKETPAKASKPSKVVVPDDDDSDIPF